MGSGKTTIGKNIALILNYNFIDTDQLIEESLGTTISKIFEIYGEKFFREQEQQLITNLLATAENNTNIALGGGSICNNQIAKLVKQKTTSIWLKTELEILLKRLDHSSNRPLLEKGNKRIILENLIKERYPFYENSDLIFENNYDDPNIAMERVERCLLPLLRELWPLKLAD
jgi:shikimate kinase